MNSPKIGFSLAEKFAIVKALDALILADGIVHDDEINKLTELMKRIDFDSNFIVQARNIATKQCALVLEAMHSNKKVALAGILEEMAIADGFVHKKESDMITVILSRIGTLQAQN